MDLRTIDHLIATQFLGWDYKMELLGGMTVERYVDEDTIHRKLPYFSKDWSFAQYVIEKLKENYGIHLHLRNHGDQYVELYPVDKEDDHWFTETIGTSAKRIETAICLAALKTIGIDVEKDAKAYGL